MQSFDEQVRAQVRRWAANWKHIGPILEAERWERLTAMTLEQRTVMAVEQLSLYQPDRPGDDGEGLLAIQGIFSKWRQTR